MRWRLWSLYYLLSKAEISERSKIILDYFDFRIYTNERAIYDLEYDKTEKRQFLKWKVLRNYPILYDGQDDYDALVQYYYDPEVNYS